MWLDVNGQRAYAYTGGRPFDPSLPVLAFVHGAQLDHSVWILQTRYLAHHGYAVLGANNRGSSGYGKTFFHMDDRRHGEVDLQDIVYGRRYLESLDWVDGDRVAMLLVKSG